MGYCVKILRYADSTNFVLQISLAMMHLPRPCKREDIAVRAVAYRWKGQFYENEGQWSLELVIETDCTRVFSSSHVQDQMVTYDQRASHRTDCVYRAKRGTAYFVQLLCIDPRAYSLISLVCMRPLRLLSQDPSVLPSKALIDSPISLKRMRGDRNSD